MPSLLQNLTGITTLPLPVKELLRDIILALCALDCEPDVEPEGPGLAVSVAVGRTNRTVETFTSASDTNEARMNALIAALASTTATPLQQCVVLLVQGRFAVMAPLTTYATAGNVTIVFGDDAALLYDNPEHASSDYTLFTGPRKIVNFGAIAKGSGEAQVSQWKALQAAANALDTLYPGPPIILESGRWFRTGVIEIPQGYIYTDQTWYVSPTVKIKGAGISFSSIWLMDNSYDNPSDPVENWTVKFERGQLIPGGGGGRTVNDNDLFGTSIEGLSIVSNFDLFPSVSSNRSASGLHLIAAQRSTINNVFVYGFGLRGVYFQGQGIDGLWVANITRGPGLETVYGCKIGYVASEHVNGRGNIDPDTGEPYPAIKMVGARGSELNQVTFEEHGLSGSGASATTALTGTAVTGITIVAGGGSYTIPPFVNIAAPPAGGTQAKATAVLTAGAVTSFVITAGGSGYLVAPSVAFTPHPQIGLLLKNCIGVDVGAVTFGVGGFGHKNTAVRIVGPTAGIQVASAVGVLGGLTPADVGLLIHDNSDFSPAGPGLDYYVDGGFMIAPYNQIIGSGTYVQENKINTFSKVNYFGNPALPDTELTVRSSLGNVSIYGGQYATSRDASYFNFNNNVPHNWNTGQMVLTPSAGLYLLNGLALGGANLGGVIGGQTLSFSATGYSGLGGLRVNGADGILTILQPTGDLSISSQVGNLKLGVGMTPNKIIIKPTGRIFLDVPVSAVGLVSGEIWDDAGTLKRVP